MNQNQLNALFHSTTDEQYKKFLCDRGWEFETEAEATAAYARMKKASSGAMLTEEEFLLELKPEDTSDLNKQLYNRLCELVEQGALRAADLYQYAHFKWCFRHPEAVIACEVGRKRWVVNNCGEEIAAERAQQIIHNEWGFETALVEIVGTPYYDATDWNFICFHCGPYDWIMQDGELHQIYQ